jgi:hypothetical protein
LADAALEALAFALDDQTLDSLYEEHRGAGYTKLITFPALTRLVGEALFANKSGRRMFESARDAKTLDASVEAAFKKLGRMPVAVSTALLNRCSARVRMVLPAVSKPESRLPASLAAFDAIVVDGKTTKGVPHRLKPLRGRGGGLVGGKGLVAYHLASGLVIGLSATEDGDANDVRLLPDLLPAVRADGPARRLWIADRQFVFLSTLEDFAKEGEAFLVRYSKGIPYERDADRPVRTGSDSEGRPVEDEEGWLGKPKAKQRRRVRRITIRREGKDPVVLVTSLFDADAYPANDLLSLYRDRPNIESVFQRVTEMLSLRRLIGTSPRATVFQLSLCLLMYNVLQLLRTHVASNADKSVDAVSPKKLLEDVRDEWLSGRTVLGADGLSSRPAAKSPDDLREQLRDRLRIWKPKWTKAERRRGRPAKPKIRSRHDSAYRLLQNPDDPT